MHPAITTQLTPHVLADRERDTRAARAFSTGTSRIAAVRRARARHVDEHGSLRTRGAWGGRRRLVSLVFRARFHADAA